MTCPDCERHKASASMWRNEAYKHAGTPLPWEPEELLRKEYERGFIDGIKAKAQQEPMVVSPECAERGCMAHDDRVDGPGVTAPPRPRGETK